MIRAQQKEASMNRFIFTQALTVKREGPIVGSYRNTTNEKGGYVGSAVNWGENNRQDVEKDVRKPARATRLSPSGLLLGMCLEPVAP